MNAWGWATAAVVFATLGLMIIVDLREAKQECEEVKSSYPYWLTAAFWVSLLSL